MHRNPRALSILVVLAVVLAAGSAPSAAADGPWQVKVSGVSAQSTAGGGAEGPVGFGLGLEYRVTPRIGVELGGFSSEVEDAEVEFFLPSLDFENEVRITPLLVRLNFHLTPGRRADLYLGPVAGHVSLSDVTSRWDGVVIATESVRIEHEAEDQLTWGGHVGVDVRLGNGSSFLTAGLTYLDVPLELDHPFAGDPTANLVPFPEDGDVDPLVFHLGYSYRF
jgi:outer membrane protein W